MNQKSLMKQFKGLNANNIPFWPIAPRLILLGVVSIAVAGGGFFFDTTKQMETLKQGQAEEVTLKEQYKHKYSQAINLELYRAQLEDVDTSFGSMLKQLPDRAQMEMLITDVNQSGVSRELMFDLFKPGKEDRKDFYAEMPISVQVQGTYHQMGMFAADIAKLSRIVTLNDVHVLVNKEGRLQMTTTAKTYRYLDENEIAQQKTAAMQDKKRNARNK